MLEWGKSVWSIYIVYMIYLYTYLCSIRNVFIYIIVITIMTMFENNVKTPCCIVLFWRLLTFKHNTSVSIYWSTIKPSDFYLFIIGYVLFFCIIYLILFEQTLNKRITQIVRHKKDTQTNVYINDNNKAVFCNRINRERRKQKTNKYPGDTMSSQTSEYHK